MIDRITVSLQYILDRTLFSPVAVLENRARMRGKRAPVLLAGMVLFAMAALLAAVLLQQIMSPASFSSLGAAKLGGQIFVTMMSIIAGLMTIVTVAFTAAGFTREKEQQTFETLMLTALSNGELVLGKLVSGVSFSFIMLLCMLPVIAISATLGGVSPHDIVLSLSLIVVSTLTTGIMGISASLQRFTLMGTSTASAIVAGLGAAWMQTLCCGWGISALLFVVQHIVLFSVILLLLSLPALLLARNPESRFVNIFDNSLKTMRFPQRLLRSWLLLMILLCALVLLACSLLAFFHHSAALFQNAALYHVAGSFVHPASLHAAALFQTPRSLANRPDTAGLLSGEFTAFPSLLQHFMQAIKKPTLHSACNKVPNFIVIV